MQRTCTASWNARVWPHARRWTASCILRVQPHAFFVYGIMHFYVKWLPSCFSDQLEKKFGRGRWDLASCQVSLKFVQRFQRRGLKCLRQSDARAAILFFRMARKTQTWQRTFEILLPVKFRWIPFSGFRGEVENVSANQRPGRPSCLSDRPEKHKLGRER